MGVAKAMAQEQGGSELNWQQQELMSKNAPKAGRCEWGDSEAPCDAPRENQSRGGGKGGSRGGGKGGGGGGKGSKEEGIKLYVGNLSWQTTRDDLGEYFAGFADVLEVVIVEDRETGSSRGFAFVYMDTQEGADEAISSANEREYMGRNLRVNIAEQSNRRGGGGGNRSYGSGGDRDGGRDRGYGGDRGGRDDGPKSSYGEWDGNSFDRSSKYGGTRAPAEGRWR